jgi:hypothetical protein
MRIHFFSISAGFAEYVFICLVLNKPSMGAFQALAVFYAAQSAFAMPNYREL